MPTTGHDPARPENPCLQPNLRDTGTLTSIGFPLMAVKSTSPAWRPLSRTAALGGIGHNGRKLVAAPGRAQRPANHHPKPSA